MRERASPGATAVDWEPGAVIGRYGLLAPLASGGMADVWLARQAGPHGFERIVALKRIIDIYKANPDFVTMFVDEARLAAQLAHPNIVQMFDFGEEAGAYFLALEYLPGESLQAVIKRGGSGRPLPLPLAAWLVAQVAGALAYAHSRTGVDGRPLQIVHRDISPRNILVTYDGMPKVLDFGIAKARHRLTNTAAGFVKGTLQYMSPEQARGDRVDRQSDLFSLGLACFELMTGAPYYDSSNKARLGQDVASLQAPVRGLRSVRREVPEALDQIVTRALARRPEDRFQSGHELQAALERWLREQSEPAGQAQVAAWMQAAFASVIETKRALIDSNLSAGVASPLPAAGGGGALRPRTEAASLPSPARRSQALLGGIAVALAVAAFAAGSLLWPDPPPVAAVVPGPETAPEPAPTVEEPGHPPPAAVDDPPTIADALGAREPERTSPIDEAVEPPKLPVPLPKQKRPARRAPPAAAPVAQGRLSLETDPWTTVYFEGRRLGDTPLLEVGLPAGRHLLVLENEQRNLRSQIEVEIAAGRTTVKRLKL